jgi:hypothetical protein
MDVDNLVWENVKTQFKNDFCATPKVSSYKNNQKSDKKTMRHSYNTLADVLKSC